MVGPGDRPGTGVRPADRRGAQGRVRRGRRLDADLRRVALGARRGAGCRRSWRARARAVRPRGTPHRRARHPHDRSRRVGRRSAQPAGPGIVARTRRHHRAAAWGPGRALRRHDHTRANARGLAARNLRPAVRQHERRCRAGVLQRRHQRGRDHRPEQGLCPLRGRAQHRVRLQGQAGRHSAHHEAAQGQPHPRGQRAQGGPARAHLGTADRQLHRQPRLGGALRSRPERHLRAAGRDLAGYRGGAQAQAAARGEEGDRAARHRQRGGLQPLPDGAADLHRR